MDLREQIARAICGNWVVGDDRPWQQWAEEADAVLEVLAKQEPVAWFEKSPEFDAWFLAYSCNPKAETRPLYAAPTPPSVPDYVANDAARYRYLASYFKCDPDMSGMHKWYGFRHSPMLRGASLNDAVDAALAAAPKHGEQE